MTLYMVCAIGGAPQLKQGQSINQDIFKAVGGVLRDLTVWTLILSLLHYSNNTLDLPTNWLGSTFSRSVMCLKLYCRVGSWESDTESVHWKNKQHFNR